MRVVADANPFVSAALGRSPESPSVRIVNAVLDGRIEPVMSPSLLAEVADVLSRPQIRKRLSGEDAQLFLADVAAQVVVLTDRLDPPSVRRDPDNYLVALAGIAGAEALVSGDEDPARFGARARRRGGWRTTPKTTKPP
ncbi:MAG: putative toxin-antitoxin system toxin component, PIN family [Solirubrobacterales bacterium]|nr:putative toxin-antitoxin system toxin component, PIN family [Solirubrobacterales bacterium]